MKALYASLLVVAAVAAAGCTSKSIYFTAQSWERNRCNQMTDNDERTRCVDQTYMPYEDYEAQADEASRR